MEIYYSIVSFVFGTIFGSFYNVVGDRLPDGKSIVTPPSHCPKCNHRLTPLELIPILSYLFQGGKCKNCKCKIPAFHPLFELFTGLMFLLTYKVFGFTLEGLMVLNFISMLLIIIVSDLNYMIIPDEALIFFGIILFILKIIISGFDGFLFSLLDGIIAFSVMFGIKLLGDFMFKKESMGGGDIKLMFFFGFMLKWPNALLSIFIGSIIGLPISIYVVKKMKTNVLPFGPLLSLGAIIIILSGFNMDKLIYFLTN